MTHADDHNLQPRVYGGWALDEAIRLDRSYAGFLARSMFGSDLKRQARFAALDNLDPERPEMLLARLEGVAAADFLASASDPLARIAQLLLHLQARAVLRAVFNPCPPGFVGFLQRTGEAPLAPRSLYGVAHRLFADPAERQRVKVIGQMGGPISPAKLQVLAALDPILAHQSVVDRVYSTGTQIDGLHIFVGMIRRLCLATDEEITKSLDQTGKERSLHAWASRWVLRQVRLPVTPPIPPDDNRFELLLGERLVRHGRTFKNCSAQRIVDPFLGRSLFYLYNGEKPVVIAIDALSEGRWVVSDVLGPRNSPPDDETGATVRSALKEYGVFFHNKITVEQSALKGLNDLLEVWRFRRLDLGFERDGANGNADIDLLELRNEPDQALV